MDRRNTKDTNKLDNTKETNSLKLALLDAIESSSSEDFDLIDVIYAVAKTYKDQHLSCSPNSNDPKQKSFVQPNVKRRRRKKRGSYYFDSNDASRDIRTNNEEGRNIEDNISLNLVNNLYEEVFSRPKARPKIANYFNLPVDDKFLGFLAIPTNQAWSVSDE